jgi:hypothetical protein
MKAILPTHPTQAMLLDQIREKKPAIDHLVDQFGSSIAIGHLY